MTTSDSGLTPVCIAHPAEAAGGRVRSVAETLEIHIVSDSTGDTAARVARAAQSQFEDVETELFRHARVKTREQLARALDAAAGRRAAVFYTLVDPALREAVLDLAREHRLVALDVLGPALNAITTASGMQAMQVPGRQAPLDAQYFRRIAAIEFAVKHDDGRGADDLQAADVVLVGVSRTSKTPTSMHLGYMGYMAANIPIVKGIDPPPSLFTVEPWKIIGLTIEAERLAEIRRRRVRALAAGSSARYADLTEIYEELEATARLHKRLGCPVIDVTKLAIEEAASRCAELVEERRRASLEGSFSAT
jgi:[pyruvate, water dikinase]-phosphate phosphotransferase / [pyruvate, water dikinase] kinase